MWPNRTKWSSAQAVHWKLLERHCYVEITFSRATFCFALTFSHFDVLFSIFFEKRTDKNNVPQWLIQLFGWTTQKHQWNTKQMLIFLTLKSVLWRVWLVYVGKQKINIRMIRNFEEWSNFLFILFYFRAFSRIWQRNTRISIRHVFKTQILM